MRRNVTRRAVYCCVVICMTVCMLYNSVCRVYADSSSTLGTPEALGSPVLNSNFSSESWDKWEMIVYGIYLSNFCVPLVDSYESAFTNNAGYGSDGLGLSALEIGSGNTADNNKIIQQLTTEAINFQATNTTQQLYVAYTKIEDGKIGTKSDPNNGATVRTARFSDLYLLEKDPSESEEKSWVDSENLGEKIRDALRNYSGTYVKSGNLPTFYVKNGEKYIEVLDYTDSWDMQIVTAMIHRATASKYTDEFCEKYKKFYGSNEHGNDGASLGFDSFGNFVCTDEGKNIVVIPAAANQHLTKTKQINLLNSWVLNGSTQNINDNIVAYGKQPLTWEDYVLSGFQWGNGLVTWVPSLINGTSYTGGGVAAFGDKDTTAKLPDETTIIFKDTDSLLDNEWTMGKYLVKLMENASTKSQEVPIKIEILSKEALKDKMDPVGNGAIINTQEMAYILCNQIKEKQAVGMDSIMLPSGAEAKMFTDDVLVTNQTGIDDNKGSKENITRQLANFMYTIYKEGKIQTTSGSIDKDAIVAKLNSAESDEDMVEVYNTLWSFYKDYASDMSQYEYKMKKNWYNANVGNRYTIVQIPSQELVGCAGLLNCSAGDFSLYATYVYVTYLNFYGINSSATLGEAGGNTTTLNEELLYNSSAKDFDISNMSGVTSKEQKEEEIRNMSYLMLSDSEEGKAYRAKIAKSNLASFISNQYKAIVYGSSETKSQTNVGKSGFLNVASLEENPFTSSIIEGYASIVIVVITAIVIFIIIAGLLRNKKFTWYLITMVIYVNIILVLPSAGNISSVLSNSAIAKMFNSKMTFWSMSEQISDSETTKTVEESGGDSSIMAELLDGLQVVASNRTLMIKKDISSKVTTELSSNYKDKLQLRSTRWILPILMQQLSSSEESTMNDYVYVNMLNMMDDASHIYLYYNGDYKDSIGTIAAQSDDEGNTGSSISAGSRKSKYYEDYTSTNGSTSYNGVNYRHIGYYESNYGDMSHTYFYLLKANGNANTALCTSSNGLVDNTDIESYQNYITAAKVKNAEAWKAEADHLESVSDEYNRQKLGTIDQGYGYLLNSESIYNYVYETVEDSFAASETTGSLIGKLQGQYSVRTDGNKVRDNFMFATSTTDAYTGDTRDILDLQEFFTNNLPYMYKMWLTAGGFDGTSGILGDKEIEDHNYYEGLSQSWMFRCNWAIKLMESKQFNGKATVADKDGNKYEVANMLLPQCYPSSRPMVFSRAQQNAYGLSDGDLSYVELKCVKVNEDTEVKWTELLNYAGTDGITKEILLRQMAIDATMVFDKQFTASTLRSSRYGLMPTTLDLRSLSFDTIMKMIILNVTKDSSYVYGSTVESLIERVDIVTSVILLLTALICTYIIPFARNLMGVIILALSVWAAVRSLTTNNTFKAKILAGALMSQLEITIVNIAYYGIISLMIKITGDDEVLSTSSVKASIASGNPIWALILIMILSIAYIVVIGKMINNFWVNRDDLGFERYTAILGTVSGSVSNGITNTVNRVGNAIGLGQAENTQIINKYVTKGEGRNSTGKYEDKSKVEIVQNKSDTVKVTEEKKNSNQNKNNDINVSIYNDNVETSVTRERNRIDEEIDKGSHSSNRESNKKSK